MTEMAELLPEEVDRIFCAEVKVNNALSAARKVAKAQRELLEGWRKVPSERELFNIMYDLGLVQFDFRTGRDSVREFHRRLMEER